jgi:integrase
MKLPNGYGTVYKVSGEKRRRKPYIVRKTIGWHLDFEKGKKVQEYLTLGYTATRAEGLQLLAEYNNNPFDLKASKMKFNDVYEKWSDEKFPCISKSNIQGYMAAYKLCDSLYDKIFKEIKLADLQYIINTCDKNYPTLRKLKVLFNQIYDFALKNEICNKDYSEFIDIVKFKDRNPNKYDRNKFEKKEIEKIWDMKDDKYYQIILMLIYSGVRVSELLDLKKEHVHLDEQYFDVIISKTDNGIRKVPIADKVLPFYQEWFDSDCEYLLYTKDIKHFQYRNYYDSYFLPLMDNLNIKRTPHCCRHSCISMLAEAHIDQTIIKKIVGHSGAMTLTEKVYTHFDIHSLINAINLI